MRTLVSLLIVALVFVLGRASAQVHNVPPGFVTAQKYLDFSEPERAVYAVGVFDGAMLAPLIQAGRLRQQQLNQCTQGMNGSDLRGMVESEIKDHPEWRHQGANVTMYRALVKGCPKVIAKLPRS